MNTHPHLESNAHVLLLAIGEIGDDLIEQTPQKQPTAPTKRTRLIRWMAVAAALLVVAISLPLLRGFFIRANDPTGDQGSSNHSGLIGDGQHYMSYEGPVMPLFGAEAYTDVTIDRSLTFDFSPFAKYDSAATVTDAYTLTNTGTEEMTLQLYYPFSATLGQNDILMPTLTRNGERLEASLLVGAADTTEQLRDARKKAGYLAYTELLEDGSYFAATQQDAPAIDLPVTVYAITNYVIHGKGANPTLNFTYQIDPTKTGVMTLGFNGGKNNREEGKYARHFSVPAPGEHGYGDVYYLIVLGDDLQNLKMQGYKDGGCDRGEEIDITAKVSRSETTLADFIRQRIAREDHDAPQYDHEGNPFCSIVSYLSDEEYFDHYAKLLQKEADDIYETWNNDFRTFEGLTSQVRSSERVMYLSMTVTLGAGESAELSATLHKEASVEWIGNLNEGYGFDMMTSLGSSLNFTAQSITLTGLQDLSVTRYNLPVAPLPTDTPIPAEAAHYFIVVNRQPKGE